VGKERFGNGRPQAVQGSPHRVESIFRFIFSVKISLPSAELKWQGRQDGLPPLNSVARKFLTSPLLLQRYIFSRNKL